MIQNILWSKGPIRDYYSSLPTECIVHEQFLINKMTNTTGILWIRNTSQRFPVVTDLDIVSNNLIYIKTPIILITSDGDRPLLIIGPHYDKYILLLILYIWELG
jgi:hypothetical protein